MKILIFGYMQNIKSVGFISTWRGGHTHAYATCFGGRPPENFVYLTLNVCTFSASINGVNVFNFVKPYAFIGGGQMHMF